MKIGVIGLWHLGEVYSACLASLGNIVVGIDEDVEVVDNLNKAIVPLQEPKLQEIVRSNIKREKLKYSTDFKHLIDCDIIWLTADIPVDKQDRANLDILFTYIEEWFFNSSVKPTARWNICQNI